MNLTDFIFNSILEIVMKRILRAFIIYSGILWFISTNIGGIEYGENITTLLMGGAALTVAEMLLKPIVNLLLLPFNLVTLGVFRWLSNVIMLYLATLAVSGFSVVPFVYKGFTSNLFIIPSFDLGLLGAYIFISIVLSVLASIVFWILH